LRIVEYIDELYLKLILLKLKTCIENSWIYWWTLFETNSLEIKKCIENSWIYWWILFKTTNSFEI
jgi:hypothetical protein